MKQSLQQQAYEVLRERIATGVYRPGEFLSENSLSEQLGIGRTPVRAAIDRLQAEGVLERRRRVGTFVRHIEPDELRELYDIRAQLEALAVRAAASQIRDDELACLEALVNSMAHVLATMQESGEPELFDGPRIRRLIAADLAFHQVLAWAGGNRWVHRILDDMQVFARFFGAHRHRYDLSTVEIIVRSHRGIVEALRRGDGDAAVAELQNQLDFGRVASGVAQAPPRSREHGPVPMRLPDAYLADLADIPEFQALSAAAD